MSRRTERVNELLREAVSELLPDIRDPRMSGLPTVTHVDTSPDLRRARVYVSVLGTEEERDSTMAALERARPYLRRELSRAVDLRHIPDLTFVNDTSLERAQEITDLLRRTAEERGETL